MFTVFLDEEAMKKKAEIIAICEDRLWHDPNFSGDSYEIEAGEYTSIDGLDAINGAILMKSIFRKLEEERKK